MGNVNVTLVAVRLEDRTVSPLKIYGMLVSSTGAAVDVWSYSHALPIRKLVMAFVFPAALPELVVNEPNALRVSPIWFWPSTSQTISVPD